ncbi:hypothetical protein [Rhizobium sp.]
MNTLARICWISSPVYLLIGMVFGMWMAATGNEELRSAHAHLNLIGGVLMAIFGGFYTLFPTAARSLLGKIHVAVTHVSIWLMFPGIIIVQSGQGDTMVKLGGVLAALSILLFLIQAARAPAARRA